MTAVPETKRRYQAIISLIVTLSLVFSLIPNTAFAEDGSDVASEPATTVAPTETQSADDGSAAQTTSEVTSEPASDLATSETSSSAQDTAATPAAPAATPESATSEITSAAQDDATSSQEEVTSAAADDATLTSQAGPEQPHDITVTVGLPSESNVKKDLSVSLTYNDKFFEQSSKTYNNDLAYASVCLAASADNSNEGGNNYALKSKNVVSYLQQIGCKDIATNDGYNYKPLQKSNIGVAIGYKDIIVNNQNYRLFVFGVRGGGYEEEWATNMRVGTEGDETGFQEARDGALGFIMPYIQKHTNEPNAPVNVKIWGSGYCRGGTTTNMAFGWLNKWVYERNNGSTYNNLAYTQNYNAEHSVMGAAYSQSDMRYTEAVSFSPKKEGGYLASTVNITNDDLYCYPVNCPFGADGTDVNNYEGLMTGIHNLINPDDWFPQVVMDWWGFKRYGYTQDHDITGTYAKDGDLHQRNLKVWDPEDAGRSKAVNAMISRLKSVDPNTAFNSSFFRQRYFSKMSVVTNTVKKVGKWIWSKIKKIWSKEPTDIPDIFQISIDDKGEGNKFYSKGSELKYNQGAYYQEFLKFLLNAAGFPDDSAGARKLYVDKYQDAFIDLMRWVCGQPLEVREKFGKVASSKVKVAFEQLRNEFADQLGSKNYILKAFGAFTKTTVGTYLYYFAAALYGVNDGDAVLPRELIRRTLKLTFDELGIAYTDAQLINVGSVIGKLGYNYYDKEQDIAKFCFFHSLTMYKAGNSIAQSHWPEQSLAWFGQCAPVSPNTKPRNAVAAQAEADAAAIAAAGADGLSAQAGETSHLVVASFENDPDNFVDQGPRNTGEILGIIDTPSAYDSEELCIDSWNLYSFEDFCDGGAALKTVTEDYVIQQDDPATIVLTPNIDTLHIKHVRLWLNKAMTGFDQDVLIGEFDVVNGGYYYIAQTDLPGDLSDEGFDVLYYGDDPRLSSMEGVTLEGWANDTEDEENAVAFLPDDFLDYESLPEGDTIDLYGLWWDPLAYGITYHANRSSSDDYVVEDAEWANADTTLTIVGLDPSDEGMKNDGKTFKGWNTAADGSGVWVNTGDHATLEQLGLGTRAQYVDDLEQLAALQNDDEPIHYVEGDAEVSAQADDQADELEAELETKYTTHLYAQWEDAAPTPAPTPGPTPAPTPSPAPLPKTGDPAAPAAALALLALVGMGALRAARRMRDDED